MIETNVGGDDACFISPWRHLRESGSIALDMGVHYTDIFRYYLGDLERVSGSAFIAEPTARPRPRARRRPPASKRSRPASCARPARTRSSPSTRPPRAS